jgi:hypothetical protein
MKSDTLVFPRFRIIPAFRRDGKERGFSSWHRAAETVAAGGRSRPPATGNRTKSGRIAPVTERRSSSRRGSSHQRSVPNTDFILFDEKLPGGSRTIRSARFFWYSEGEERPSLSKVTAMPRCRQASVRVRRRRASTGRRAFGIPFRRIPHQSIAASSEFSEGEDLRFHRPLLRDPSRKGRGEP